MLKTISKEAIKEVIDFGGKITISYKANSDEWFSNVEIVKVWGSTYVVSGYDGNIYEKFKDYNVAYEYFSQYFRNIGSIQSEIIHENPDLEPEDPDDWEKIKEMALERYNSEKT